MALPRQVPRVGNNVPGQRHGHVPVTQQTVPVIKEIIPYKNVIIADKKCYFLNIYSIEYS